MIMRYDDPAIILMEETWRRQKRALRALRYRERMRRVPEPDPRAWLEAMRRETDIQHDEQ